MKTVKDKQILMAADFAGYPLKEAIKEYLEKKGWTVTDIGVKADSDPNDTELMFHRIGLRVGAMITEKEFERALIFCGTGMGIHIAASKCPGVRRRCRVCPRSVSRDHGERRQRPCDGRVLCDARTRQAVCGRIPLQ